MFRRIFLLALIAGVSLTVYMYQVAKRDPIIHRSQITLTNWPKDQPKLKILLASDVHVAGPDMPPERLAGIVAQIAKLEPDIVLFAGDFVSDKALSTHKYSSDEALAPLGSLRPPLGSLAVLGNHDHWRNKTAITNALVANGVEVLNNNATKVGPLIIGGLDDDFTGNSDLPKLLSHMAEYDGIRVILSHSPDAFPDIPDDVPLTLAGHTHCGQIALPFFGPLATASRHGDRFACGKIMEGKKTIIVGAGLGTSILPLRLGAVPDMWLISLGPPPKD
jgi:uncharacterized protein